MVIASGAEGENSSRGIQSQRQSFPHAYNEVGVMMNPFVTAVYFERAVNTCVSMSDVNLFK
jgi:hypothetical protein